MAETASNFSSSPTFFGLCLLLIAAWAGSHVLGLSPRVRDALRFGTMAHPACPPAPAQKLGAAPAACHPAQARRDCRRSPRGAPRQGQPRGGGGPRGGGSHARRGVSPRSRGSTASAPP